jgi:hypothetical protein
MRRGSMAAATGGKQPSWISGWPKRERSLAKSRSQQQASSRPPPRQWPSTAATVSASSARSRSSAPWKPSSMRSILSGVWSWIETPAENALPPSPRDHHELEVGQRGELGHSAPRARRASRGRGC